MKNISNCKNPGLVVHAGYPLEAWVYIMKNISNIHMIT